ncbi:MAG: peptidase domain-containing ABC transporter, partial [Holophagales bacterium]|nr:peptidase domain-containing ABC transporter [Holophagales bacterium]
LFLQLIGLVFPAITALAVDWILPMGVSDAMGVLALAMGVTLLSKALLSFLRATLLLRLRMRLDSRMMMAFFEHLLSLPFRFFQMRNQGDLLMRLSSNSMIRETLTNQSLSVLLDGSFVVVTWLILFHFASNLAWLVAGLGAAQVLLAAATLRPMQRLMERDLAAKAEEQSYLVETLGGIATLKVAGAEGHAFGRWSDLFLTHMRVSIRRGQIAAMIETVMATLRTASPLVLLWYGVGQVLAGSWTLGSMLAWNAIAANFLSPLGSLVASLQSFQLLGAHLARVGDVLEAEAESHLEPATPVPERLRGAIEVDGVSFRYHADGPEVLRDIRFSIRPGEKVAIVGATGSGKSTLGLVLLGMLPVEKGEVRFDGVPIEKLGLRYLRRQVGAVLQNPSLWSGSIRGNIGFLRPEMPLEEVVEAARMAAIHDEIAALPMAYETRVAEGGSAISGGQKQRIALARALASKPAILLLDEATSHLDQKTEAIVDRHLGELRCTRIVIAHRLSTVQNADSILVLDNGRLVEQGTHEELMGIEGGTYAEQVRARGSGRGTGSEPPSRGFAGTGRQRGESLRLAT